MGPRLPSPEHPRPCRRAPPSKRTRTSGPGESSRFRPELSPPPADQSLSPQLSPASRIRRPMFSYDMITGNINLRARDIHMESYYDIPALTASQRFRDSMRLIQRFSLLLFMTPRQFFYSRVLLEFHHTMTSRGVPSLMEIRFSIDDRFGVLRAANITTTLGHGLSVVASAITERDGSLTRSRYHGRAYTLSPTAFPADASRGPCTSDQPIVDPTRSTDRRDSLLNGRKMWIDFRVLENPSPRRNVFL